MTDRAPRPVVAGLDGSPESLAAADWAASEARYRGAPLRLLYAWEPAPAGRLGIRGPETPPEWASRVLPDAARELRRRHADLDVQTRQYADDAVSVLTEAAEEAELLVLGSRGLSGLTGFLVGSVAMAVVARTERPVVLVRAPGQATREHPPGRVPDTEGDASGGTPRPEVVLGAKLSPDADALFRFAFDTAARRGVRLRVVHTWNFPPVFGYAAGVPDPSLLRDLGAEEAQALEAALAPWRERYPQVEVVPEVISGRAGPHLAEAGASAQLVVVGRRFRRTRLGSRIGPVAHAVMHHCAAPVAVVPHG